MRPLRYISQLVTLVSVGSAFGLALNATSSRAIALSVPVFPTSASGAATCSAPHGSGAPAVAPAPGRMSQRDAVEGCTSCTVGFVDARGAAAFAAGHIPGAVHLPPREVEDAHGAVGLLRQFHTVVVYDAGVGCNLAKGVADRLAGEGFSDVRILDGSWTGWQAEGGPGESGACRACGAHLAEGGH